MSGKPRSGPRSTVRNLQRKVPVDIVDLEKFARKAVQFCLDMRRDRRTDLGQLQEIFVFIVSDRRIASLHRQFMNQPGPTDVLTFQHGEIFVSAETARRNARRFATTLARELGLYIVHGLLHLHGFDDATRAGEQKMKAIQQRILDCVGALN